jgi:hypothetical protein
MKFYVLIASLAARSKYGLAAMLGRYPYLESAQQPLNCGPMLAETNRSVGPRGCFRVYIRPSKCDFCCEATESTAAVSIVNALSQALLKSTAAAFILLTAHAGHAILQLPIWE